MHDYKKLLRAACGPHGHHTVATHLPTVAREPNGSHGSCMRAVLLCYACCAAVLCTLCCCAMHSVLMRCAAAHAAHAAHRMLCIAGRQKGLPPIARHLPGRWLHQWAGGTGHTAAQVSPDACCDPNAVVLGSSTAHNCCLLPAHQHSYEPLAEVAERHVHVLEACHLIILATSS